LVVGVGVEGEVAEELAGDGVDDSDVEVLDEQDDAGSLVGSADADVPLADREFRRSVNWLLLLGGLGAGRSTSGRA